MNLGGPIALVLKVSGKESKVDSAEIDGSRDEDSLMNSEVEPMALLE